MSSGAEVSDGPGDLIYEVEEIGDSDVRVYPFGSDFSPASSEEYLDQIPFVLRISQDEQKPHMGYYSEEIDDKKLKQAMDAVSKYLEEQGYDAAIHLKQGEEQWEDDVKAILEDKREEVTDTNNSVKTQRPGTAPHSDRVPPSKDDTYSFDVNEGWEFD